MLYTVAVRDGASGLPVRGAIVEVGAVGVSQTIGPSVANELGGTYQVLLPGAADQRWQVSARIAVAEDSFTFEHEFTSRSDGQPRRVLSLVAGAVLVTLTVAALLPVRAMRRRAKRNSLSGQ